MEINELFSNYCIFLYFVKDPHYSGSLASVKDLYDSGMVSWRPLDSFLEHSFYNFCLPQLKAK